MKELSELQTRIMTPWDTVRHDYITLEMALEHLRTVKPRVAYIALGETDDWAHDRRYDRVLQAIEYFDSALRELWNFLESSAQYRGTTSLIITVDHGRGSTLEDWSSHGSKVKGAEQIWIAIAGPDTPGRGELSNTAPVFQRDVAPTMLDLLGIDYREYKGVLGKPIAAAKAAGN
jgi:bisphosphoglycerate-independent phosphoglycerate mutase (AlkP superfamily)